MSVIRLETRIKAKQQIVFDLSRSIDFQSEVNRSSDERAVAGRTTGLIGPGETVTWRGRHLGIVQSLSTKVTEFDPPHFFADEMQKGAFKSFRHEHYFISTGEGTLMRDVFSFRTPLGVLGRLVNFLFLKAYMTNFLKNRNRILKEYAESGKWKEILKLHQ
ncbi:SRPBCC family protein [Salinimicrobium sp. HB62]|uniref:SRPBCC family protein n=1 Tax=Salinimicrobium sp. HB62 TaxID=3077781 RepID=UPI002D790939|nr:SRPBCC family protein [Salinimicrobium sp. HB62]